MREITLKSGAYKGVNYVFETTSEAHRYLTSKLKHLNVNKQDLSDELEAFKPWFEGNRFDWVKTDDGCVLQILNKWDRTKTRHDGTIQRFTSTQQEVRTIMFNTVVGNYAIWNKADGTWSNTRLHAMPKCVEDIKVDRTSISGKSRNTVPLGKFLTHKKRIFALHVAMSGNPFESLKHVRQIFKLDRYAIGGDVYGKMMVKQVISLMSDKYVIEIIKSLNTNMDEFKEKVKQSLVDHGGEVDTFVAAITRVAKTGKRDQDVLKASEMGLNLNRFVEDETDSLNHDGTKKGSGSQKALENAKFTEINNESAPSQLSEPDANNSVSFADKMQKAVVNANPDKISVDDILPE